MENFKIKKFIYILIIIVFPLKSYGQTFGFDVYNRGNEHHSYYYFHDYNYWNSIYELESHSGGFNFCEKYSKDNYTDGVKDYNNPTFNYQYRSQGCYRERLKAITFYIYKFNDFEKLVDLIDYFPNLVKINIIAPSDFKFKKLPDEFVKFNKISALAINANIENLTNISQLKNLEYLQIASDSLKTIPISLNQLKKLKYLYLMGNLCFDEYLYELNNFKENIYSKNAALSFSPEINYVSFKNANPLHIKEFKIDYTHLKSLYLNISKPINFKRANQGSKYFDFFYVSSKAIFHPKDNIVVDVLILDKKSEYENLTINNLITDSIDLINELKNCRINKITSYYDFSMPNSLPIIEIINKSNNQWNKLYFIQTFDTIKNPSIDLKGYYDKIVDQKKEKIRFGRSYKTFKFHYLRSVIKLIVQKNETFKNEFNKFKNICILDSLTITHSNSKISFSKVNFVNILNIESKTKLKHSKLKSNVLPIIDSMFIKTYHPSFKHASINFLQIDSLSDLNQLQLNNSIRVLKILKISKDIDTVKLITLINGLNYIETVNLPFIKSVSKINLINANIILELELDYYIKYIDLLQNRKLLITYNYPDEIKLIKYFNPNVTLK
jgi:hypothetical protein